MNITLQTLVTDQDDLGKLYMSWDSYYLRLPSPLFSPFILELSLKCVYVLDFLPFQVFQCIGNPCCSSLRDFTITPAYWVVYCSCCCSAF